MSHTAMVSELILTPDETDDDERGRYYDPIAGGTQFTTLYPPNTSVPDHINWISKNPVPKRLAYGARAVSANHPCFFTNRCVVTTREA